MGKTVLLNAFEDRAESEGFLTFYHELTPDSGLVTEIARDTQSALGRLRIGGRARQAVSDVLAQLKTIRGSVGPNGFELSVDLGRADEGTITRDLSELLLSVGAVAREKGRGLVFLLDEIQFADEVQYRSLISALHRVTQKQLPITVAGAGLPQIPRLTGEARSYAERLFTFPVIANLDGEAASDALVEPARQREVVFAPEAVRAAYSWTEGYPFYIQQLGKHAWNIADASPIPVDVVREAIPAAQQALDSSIYEVRVQRATEGERHYMRAMAELGSGPYRSGEIAAQLGRRTEGVSVTRQQLLDKGLIYATEDYGYVDFTIPRFDEYMRRYMP